MVIIAQVTELNKNKVNRYISLQELTMIIKQESGSEEKGRDDNPDWLKSDGFQRRKFSRPVLTLNLLADMCETLGPSFLKSSQHVLEFVKVLFVCMVCKLISANIIFQYFLRIVMSVSVVCSYKL